MKIVITLALVLLSYLGFAQQLTTNIKQAIKADDAEALLKEIKAEKLSINDCFEIQDSSYSLLTLSIRMEKSKIFNALIENKADLNKVCSDKSPLMYAAKYGKLEMAKALIKAGADLKQVNNERKTALDYAIKYEMKELETYLLSLTKTK